MRTTKEILDRLENYEGMFCAGDLVLYLPFEHAKKYLKDEYIAEVEKGEVEYRQSTDDDVRESMRTYMDFAFEKMDDHRGISASRSIEHYENWLWLLNDDELLDKFLRRPYQNYGAPKLQLIIETFFPDYERASEEWFVNMAEGDPCRPGCDWGCAY